MYDAVAAAQQAVSTAWAAGMAAPPIRGPAEWAEACRILGTNETPFPGRWSNARTPFMVEPMGKMALSHPAQEVTLKMAAQIAKTQGSINFLGQVITETPCPALVVVPTKGEAIGFHKDKLGPMIDNTPAVSVRVDPNRSSAAYKAFPGGHIEIVGANSSAGLQSRSCRVVIMDELSEFPFDVDNRGDPAQMAEARTTAFGRRAKIIKTSTPAIKGSCRITAAYEAGSRAKYHVPCPHCGERQALEFGRLVYDADNLAGTAYACVHCGALISEGHKAGMLAGGAWVHERPELADHRPSYELSGLYSPFRPWSWVAERRERSRNDPTLDRVFSQQVLGEAWEPTFNTVPHQELWQRREEWPAGRIPPQVLFLEGATDVQGDRLEWAVYGFDRDFGQWWIDGGVLAGDPSEGDVWDAMAAVMVRQWTDARGEKWGAESWGIDSGFLSQAVYRYVRRHASRYRPRVMALDGRSRWNEPAIGTAKAVDVDWNGKKIGSVMLWPCGTWDLKAELTSAMMATQHGPDGAGIWPKGAMRFPNRLDIGFFEQLTAEVLNTRKDRRGMEIREWLKTRSRNEQLDLAVYARGLARHDTAGWTEHMWQRLEQKRRAGDQPDLLDAMQTQHGESDATPPSAPPREPPPIDPTRRVVAPRALSPQIGRRLA